MGDAVYHYDADRYLIVTVGLPVAARVVEASPARPYLSLRLDLDPAQVSSIMIEAGFASPPSSAGVKAIAVSTLDTGLLDATVRLVRLLESPHDAPVLVPLVKREITFRLMQGEQGGRLRHLPMLGARTNRIAEAVHRLRRDFDRTMNMESLAKELGMSTSAFHQHFKALTEMSPLQFQKLIRLQEARRLMLVENLDAASAAYRVGYEDPSHFSRDYKKRFGESPIRDVDRLRQGPGT
ncbi:MAG: AraC family transcriptional regulator [Chthonomonas sp.]